MLPTKIWPPRSALWWATSSPSRSLRRRSSGIWPSGIAVRRANYDHAHEVYDFCRKMVPRTEKQTRSLLKNGNYGVFVGETKGRIVGIGEMDMRFGPVATVEQLEGKVSLIQKGLGQAMLVEMFRVAGQQRGIEHVDFLMKGDDDKRRVAYREAGFQIRQEAHLYERSV